MSGAADPFWASNPTLNEFNLHVVMLREVPRLQEIWPSKPLWAEEPYPPQHWIVGDVFVESYLMPLLAKGDTDGRADEIRTALEFIERMVRCGDELVRDVVETTILERMINTDELSVARKYMGPATLATLKDMGA